MGCLSQSQVTEYLASAALISGQLTLLCESFNRSIETSHIEEYRFDGGDGSQRTLYRDPEKLEKMIRSLKSRHDWYVNQVQGRGISNMNLRRDNAGRYVFS